MGLASGLESAGHSFTKIEKKPTLFHVLSREFDVIAEAIMNRRHGYHKTVSNPFLREARMQNPDRNRKMRY